MADALVAFIACSVVVSLGLIAPAQAQTETENLNTSVRCESKGAVAYPVPSLYDISGEGECAISPVLAEVSVSFRFTIGRKKI